MKRMVRILAVLLSCMIISSTVYAVEAGDQAPTWQGRDLSGNAVEFPQPGTGQTTVLG